MPTDRPTPARVYDYGLGGKDNFAVDREFARTGLNDFPEILDVARENRLFLYRAVRFLAQEAGIRQFLDLGSGLPAQQNVHEVAQRFQPDARVVYVDNDPIVLAHGRALLADDKSTAFIAADMTTTDAVLNHEDTQHLLDFSQPVAVLFLSVPHSIPDDADADAMVRAYIDALPSGSYVALTQIASPDEETAAEMSAFATDRGMPWKTRTPDQVRHFLRGLEPVAPGFVDIGQWRPDPHQPPLNPVDPAIAQHLGAAAKDRRFMEHGGVARKP
ncbi:SAM-dependent methyltransferase [Spiractinospora alimapuensis]|uniref:SAM-dependent methyltransferase n=1 Tax=Spiractinospora alimapuensis TaxID=2820884 RepID=UPI001F37FFA5|nr:SAM-dependent methyltransferase [Spiractinospora alimapuensis]